MTEAYNEFSLLSRRVGSYLADLIDLLNMKRANMTEEEVRSVIVDLNYLAYQLNAMEEYIKKTGHNADI
jgi:hypothetical protein